LSKWRNLKGKDVRKVIKKLDLEPGNSKRSKHDQFWYRLDGKKVTKITMPNVHGGSGSMSTGFLKQIRKRLRLDTSQFEDLVDCPLSAEEYEGIARNEFSK